MTQPVQHRSVMTTLVAHVEPSAQRILVVDDERDAADSVATLLTELGHTVRQAYDGPSALAMTKEFAPELVLLDLSMPGMDGFEVAERLRGGDQPLRAKIVALTGHTESPFKEALAEADFDGHLLKPVNARELSSVLSRDPGVP